MAKQYAVKNTTDKPARPLILMTSPSGGAVGQSHRLIDTNDFPVMLTETEYGHCKDAIAKYVEAGMMSLNVLVGDEAAPVVEETPAEPPAPETDEEKEIKDLREKVKDLGVRGWHTMGKEKLESVIAEAEKGSDGIEG